MKKVVLIGDSIRMGYEPTVRQELEGVFEVWAPEKNSGKSTAILENLDEWVLSQNPDIVHINCGHHDLRKAFDAADSNIPLAQHRQNVETILMTIREKTQARVIWVTTTPVNEKWHHERKPFDRFEKDVAAYNAADTETAQRLGIEVNDLYQVVMDAGRDELLKDDGVHFTDHGKEVQGKAVAAFLRRFE